MIRRRPLLGAAAALPAAALASRAAIAANGNGQRVLRYAFPTAETGFDPAQISDIYSRIVTSHIFEAPYDYDHLARPYKIKPVTALALPEVSDDYKTFVVRLRPGILFNDDAAFGGKPRELVAEDFVYSFKRLYDPVTKAPSQSIFEENGVIGLRELREEALKGNKRFDYDKPVEGMQALDRYTLRFRLRESRPRFIYSLAAPDVYGAVAREVVEKYGDAIPAHPVGTGPFVLKEWRRSSRIVLERNPRYRDRSYDAEPNADDATGQAIAARFKGRRMPMLDRVEVSIVEEAQPRWLAFLNEEHDFLEGLPSEFSDIAIPGGKLAPHLAKRGISALRVPAADITLTVYNMEHAAVGGYTPERVALRRAMNLAIDVDREIRLVRRGQAIPAQSIVPPMTFGYDPDLRTEMGEHSLPRAKALLDLFGYVDRDGDGWREQPDGTPLTIELSTQSDQRSRQADEVWKKSLDALGVRVVLKNAQWAENLKAARAGTFMVWRVGSTAASPDGQGALERCYGPSTGKGNIARFRLKAFDELYERMKLLPDAPERAALFQEAAKLMVAYAPYRFHAHRILTDLAHPRVRGYRRPPFWLGWWHYVDVEPGPHPSA